MPTFIQFLDPAKTVVNLNHLAGITRSERDAAKIDEEQKGPLVKEGETIYRINVTPSVGREWSMDYSSQAARDRDYHEILALLRPIIIGAKSPVSTAVPTTQPVEPTVSEPPTPPTPKSPRQPRAKKGEE